MCELIIDSLYPSTVLLDKHSVNQHVKQLEDRFLELTECTYEVLVAKGIDVHRLHARLVSLDVFRRHEHQEFIDKHLMNIGQEMTFNNLWARLGNYWDFLNFDLLEHVVSRFGSEDLKHKMESYKHDLQSFRKATRLCDFIDCWPVRGQTPPETELREFVIKVGHHWDNCTLEDLEKLKGVITRKFFLREFDLRLKEIKEGCITIIWLIPELFVEDLQVAIESTSSEFFLEQKIETITIDGQEYHPSSMKAKKYVREKCVDEISQHVKLLPSVEQYLNKAEEEADPSLPIKYKDYLFSTPAIRAALYTTFNAKMAAEAFGWNQHTESPPPTTMTELFTAFTLKTLVDHLSTHPVYHKQQLKVTTFSDLPTDVYKQFQDLCRMAYEGILNRQQLVFSAAHLPTGFAPLGLMQEVPQLYTVGRSSSYHFIHLTLQEYLASIHISQLPAHEQTRLFQEHVKSGHFKMTMRFLAGRTKLGNIPPDIKMRLMDTKLNYFHFLFEAKDVSMTTRTLGSDEMVVRSHYSWTPLDYYVTGHAISHSICPWKLHFFMTSIDNEKFELFCQGCATPGGTGCRGHISYAHFSGNNITFKSIQSFVNIPPHILQNMRVLDLSQNKLDGSACDLLAKAVPSMSRLEELSLSYNPIGSSGAVEVIKALCGSGVKLLSLWMTGIGVPDCEALCELLKSTHSLQHIDQNNLSSGSVASIITGLNHNSTLTILDISNSHFSMANVDSLASVLKDHSKSTLTDLYLQDCHISSEGGVKLAAALCKNSTLEYLNLNRNLIGEHVEGATAVAKTLVKNKSLTKLDLQDCHISSECVVELAAVLYKNPTLKHLNLDRNPISVEGASSMSDMLQHNTSLEYLTLCDDSVGEEGVHQLINSLKHNQTLRHLWLPEKYKSVTSDHRIRWL